MKLKFVHYFFLSFFFYFFLEFSELLIVINFPLQVRVLQQPVPWELNWTRSGLGIMKPARDEEEEERCQDTRVGKEASKNLFVGL